MNYGHGYRNNKYRNRKTRGFDSAKEANRYNELRLLERAGIIEGLRRQVHFELTPTVREPGKTGPRGGSKPGRVILQKSEYVADFVYCQNGEIVVEDVKGYRGGEAYKLFVLKKKVLYDKTGILIKEV